MILVQEQQQKRKLRIIIKYMQFGLLQVPKLRVGIGRTL